MRILIVGGGGREHALARRLAREDAVAEVILAPGNEGAARHFRCFSVAESDAGALAALCARERVNLVVIGPEAPLAAGVADALRERGVATFGPSREAARLESSKWFAKQIMISAGVPTARAERHERWTEAQQALDRFRAPWVIKADGLAAGKGVCVARERAEAERFVAGCLEGRLGAGGRSVVIEEFLEGEEATIMAICDGMRHVLLAPARDFKRALDHDHGPNTGGMGSCAPLERVDASLEREVGERIVQPVLEAMSRRGSPYRGLLYCGLMIGSSDVRVLEFNARFGDPETQAVLPITGGALGALLKSAAMGSLDDGAITREHGAAVAVALVDEGYPDALRGGGRIEGLDRMEDSDTHVIHAAAAWRDGAWTASGGRAAYVVAEGPSVAAARERAYRAIDRLGGSGWRCRRDIAAGGGGGEAESAAGAASGAHGG
ncbi:MAG: phosphoribosylamine--glycine ligase [Candidatus Eisenbacteria bacterium]|nr:phosphoribosylamine--glycine ligase [Candidatus Eisenbacteria bacterium]